MARKIVFEIFALCWLNQINTANAYYTGKDENELRQLLSKMHRDLPEDRLHYEYLILDASDDSFARYIPIDDRAKLLSIIKKAQLSYFPYQVFDMTAKKRQLESLITSITIDDQNELNELVDTFKLPPIRETDDLVGYYLGLLNILQRHMIRNLTDEKILHKVKRLAYLANKNIYHLVGLIPHELRPTCLHLEGEDIKKSMMPGEEQELYDLLIDLKFDIPVGTSDRIHFLKDLSIKLKQPYYDNSTNEEHHKRIQRLKYLVTKKMKLLGYFVTKTKLPSGIAFLVGPVSTGQMQQSAVEKSVSESPPQLRLPIRQRSTFEAIRQESRIGNPMKKPSDMSIFELFLAKPNIHGSLTKSLKPEL